MQIFQTQIEFKLDELTKSWVKSYLAIKKNCYFDIGRTDAHFPEVTV